MVASLEALADILNISNAVVGVTVSAAGTSLPNYVGSKVAAEKGFGVRCRDEDKDEVISFVVLIEYGSVECIR